MKLLALFAIVALFAVSVPSIAAKDAVYVIECNAATIQKCKDYCTSHNFPHWACTSGGRECLCASSSDPQADCEKQCKSYCTARNFAHWACRGSECLCATG